MLLGAFLHCASFGCIWVRSSSSSGGRRLDGALGLDRAAAAVLGRSAEADVSWTLLLLQHPHPRLTGWQLLGVSDKTGASDKIKQASKVLWEGNQGSELGQRRLENWEGERVRVRREIMASSLSCDVCFEQFTGGARCVGSIFFSFF